MIVGSGARVQVEFKGVVEFILESSHVIFLKDVAYIPSFRQNLISISRLDNVGYSFNISNGTLKLIYDSNVARHVSLSDGLYRLYFSSIATSLNVENVGTKRILIKEKSCTLWHRRLGHISKERIERLIKNYILPSLDFGDFGICVDCIRGQLTNTK